MHGSLDTVIHLEVKFGKLVLLVSRGFLDISEWRGINNVAYDEAFDGLVLRDGLAGGGASENITRIVISCEKLFQCKTATSVRENWLTWRVWRARVRVYSFRGCASWQSFWGVVLLSKKQLQIYNSMNGRGERRFQFGKLMILSIGHQSETSRSQSNRNTSRSMNELLRHKTQWCAKW